jgi:cell filamentation protein
LLDDTPITAEGYCEIHRYIFQDVYDWAGEVRTVDIAKSDGLFCLAPYIDQELASSEPVSATP